MYLAVPESMTVEEAPGGVDRDTADRAFGGLEYCSVPSIGLHEPPILGVLLKEDAPLPPLWRSLLLREVLAVLAGTEALPGSGGCQDGTGGSAGLRLLRSYHVLQWLKDSAFCGSCGEKNGDSPRELARLCPRCGRIEYPRITPAVIVLITDDAGRVILAHNEKFKDNMYSLIAGFTEPGESLEAAARREIKEEINIGVQELYYITSQSWPFPNSLMVGFTARYASGGLQPDGKEILDARWFTRESILQKTVDIPGPGSVSRYIINKWLEGAIG
jgi:NAD+ diphosphatase